MMSHKQGTMGGAHRVPDATLEWKELPQESHCQLQVWCIAWGIVDCETPRRIIEGRRPESPVGRLVGEFSSPFRECPVGRIGARRAVRVVNVSFT